MARLPETMLLIINGHYDVFTDKSIKLLNSLQAKLFKDDDGVQ